MANPKTTKLFRILVCPPSVSTKGSVYAYSAEVTKGFSGAVSQRNLMSTPKHGGWGGGCLLDGHTPLSKRYFRSADLPSPLPSYRSLRPFVPLVVVVMLLQILATQQKLDEVKDVMVASVELVLERGERLELLVDKTDNLQQQVCLTKT